MFLGKKCNKCYNGECYEEKGGTFMSNQDHPPKIQSLLVGFSIIDLVAKSAHPIKFNDIHHYTKISKSNLYKYLNTLTSLQVLHRDPETGLYSGGPALIQYGMATVNRENIIDKVNPYLEEINLLSKETTLLAVWTHNGPMIVKMIYSRAGLNLGGQLGTILPINSAAGKLFAAFKSGPLVENWMAESTESLPAETVHELQNDFQYIRKDGIAFAHEALAPSVASAAIPIFNYEQEIIGAVIIVGFRETIPAKPEDEMSIELLKKSRQISELFGFSGLLNSDRQK